MNTQAARAALREVASYLEAQAEAVPAHQVEEKVAEQVLQAQKAMQSFLLALLADVPVPVSHFKAFASYKQFYRWRKAGQIDCRTINGKVCVEPHVFFAFWKSLRAAPLAGGVPACGPSLFLPTETC